MFKAITRETLLRPTTSINTARAQGLLSQLDQVTRKRTATTMTSFPPPELKQLAEDIARILKERGETVAVAETAAGGLMSASLLAQPGASKYYKGGLTVCPQY